VSGQHHAPAAKQVNTKLKTHSRGRTWIEGVGERGVKRIFGFKGKDVTGLERSHLNVIL
jgi:hypothetical protein